MRRITDPPSLGKHDSLCDELNEMAISIKLHKINHQSLSKDQEERIIKAQKAHKNPTWEDIIQLLERVRDDMNSCRESLRKY